MAVVDREIRQRLYGAAVEVIEYDSDPEHERLVEQEQAAQDWADAHMNDRPHWSEER